MHVICNTFVESRLRTKSRKPKIRIGQNPEVQNSELDKIANGQNPKLDKIPNGQNLERTKFRIGQDPELDKIPNWTKFRIG